MNLGHSHPIRAEAGRNGGRKGKVPRTRGLHSTTALLRCYTPLSRYTTLHSTCEHCTGDLRMVIRSTSTMCKNDYSFC